MEIYWLEQLEAADRMLVGDKAWHLSRILRRGYPVLPGFVVSARVLGEFLQTLTQSEPLIADLPHSSLHLDVENPSQLQRVAQRLRQAITTAPLPPEWVKKIAIAVEQWQAPALIFRPSLALDLVNLKRTSIAGLLEAQISPSEPEAIALALKQMWSQLFRAKSLFYWQRIGIELHQINLAVLVQPLANAIASGVVTYQPDEMEIQASWGLGIARGEIQPDSYWVHPVTGVVRSQQLGNKTLAYSLVNSPLPEGFTACSPPLLVPPVGSCWQAYLVSEAQQQQYTLADKHLQQLIQLAQQLQPELGSAFTFEWTLSALATSPISQLQLTQVATDTSSRISSHLPTPLLIRGLAAAGGRVAATAYVITNASQIPKTLPAGVILVTPAIAPDWLPLIRQVSGIVTEYGGLTSHSAILARELGIPAVVSATQATQAICTGEALLLDGDLGEVYLRQQTSEIEVRGKTDLLPSLILTNGNQAYGTGSNNDSPVLHSDRDGKFPPDLSSKFLPRALPPDVPIATQLLINLSQPSLLERSRSLPVDGIGLLRSEMMALTVLQGQHPQTWIERGHRAELVDLWQKQIMEFVQAFAPRPVFYRSLDWRAHEFKSLTPALVAQSAASETNPMLGLRGTFSYLQDPTLFDLELAALAAVQQSGYTNLRLLLPFVRTVEEFSFCRRRVEQAGLTQSPQFQLWIMAEVPSVLFLLPQYVAAGVQGISIGTNDLTQLLLGVDRDQGQLAAVFDEQHPVVLQAIAQIIQLARQANVPCSICGQAPARFPELIDSLVRWGITSISVEPNAVEQTYIAIARAEQRLLLEVARKQNIE